MALSLTKTFTDFQQLLIRGNVNAGTGALLRTIATRHDAEPRSTRRCHNVSHNGLYRLRKLGHFIGCWCGSRCRICRDMPCRRYRLLADGIACVLSNSPGPRHGTQYLLYIHSCRSIGAFVVNRPRRGLSFRTDLSSVERSTRSRMDRKRHSQNIKNGDIGWDRHVFRHHCPSQCRNCSR